MQLQRLICGLKDVLCIDKYLQQQLSICASERRWYAQSNVPAGSPSRGGGGGGGGGGGCGGVWGGGGLRFISFGINRVCPLLAGVV